MTGTPAVPTMAAPTMMPNKNHTDKPGNPSTATSSQVKLRTSIAEGGSLRILSEEDWKFWIEKWLRNYQECGAERTSTSNSRFHLGI